MWPGPAHRRQPGAARTLLRPRHAHAAHGRNAQCLGPSAWARTGAGARHARGDPRAYPARDLVNNANEVTPASAMASVPVTARHGAAMPAGHRRTNPLSRSEEHTSELQSLMRTSYAVFCLKKKTKQ